MRSAHLYMTLALVSAPLVSCLSSDEADLTEIGSAFSQVFTPEIEPNGASATATPLVGNSAVAFGSINPLADRDFYSFQANPGDRVYAMTSSQFSVNGSTDMDLNVRGTDGTTLIEFDDQNGTFGGFSPVIAGAQITTAGTNFLEASYYLDGNRVQPYQLHFAKQSGAPGPEAEPNDTTATATPLNAAGYASGALSSATDVDVYAITLNAGDTVFAALDLDPERDNAETAGSLSLSPLGGSTFTVNDLGDAGPDAEGLVATVKAAGTYFISVAGTTAGTYQLSVTKTAQATPPGVYNLHEHGHPEDDPDRARQSDLDDHDPRQSPHCRPRRVDQPEPHEHA
ncbi:MAG: PPC domain-containing protein [Polyangiaceae bacterium]